MDKAFQRRTAQRKSELVSVAIKRDKKMAVACRGYDLGQPAVEE